MLADPSTFLPLLLAVEEFLREEGVDAVLDGVLRLIGFHGDRDCEVHEWLEGNLEELAGEALEGALQLSLE